MAIKTRVMQGKKQTPKFMFERMVQKQVEAQTGNVVYASGIEYHEDSEMWFFRCDTLTVHEDADVKCEFNWYEGYISCLGMVVITKVNGKKKEEVA